jgi:alpha-glucoside transport system substrate-binding protein
MLRPAVLLAASALTLTGCLQEPGAAGGGGGGGSPEGQVEIFGAFTGEEQRLFEEAIADFEDESGIDIRYSGSADFTTLIRSRVQGQDAPDIALFPQPGLLMDLSDAGNLLPLGEQLDLDQLEQTLIPGFLDATTGEDGEVYGVPMRMAVKSLVWHPTPEFDKQGYRVPESHDQLVSLSDEIKQDGTPPWCMGIEAGAGTGWVATDWIEEYVLRIGGPEVYDQWVAHEIPFNDPVVKEAAQKVEELLLTQGNTLGGSAGIVNTPFGEAGNPMFEQPPACWLMRQGNFITGFFPEDVQKDIAAQAGLFVLPPVEDGYDGQPILGGGDIAGMFNDESDTQQVMEYLSSPEFGGPWAQGGGWLSPHRTFDASQYPDDVTRQIATIASEADVFRFDGSDLMPAQVGAGTFWRGMVEWLSGRQDIDTALQEIEDSWPAQ